MLPNVTVPASLASLLAMFAPCFTAPTFTTFCGLVTGFVAQTGRRTVCAMLVAAGLSPRWPHDRAHDFFARAAWSPDAVGLALAKLVVRLLLDDDEPVTVAIDDTLFKRRGRRIWAASWFHDGSAITAQKVGYGNNWVILGIIVRLPFINRPVCLPVLARLVKKDTTSASRLWLAAQMMRQLAQTLPGRTLHAAADAAYAGSELADLVSAQVTWTTRLRKDAALYEPAPPPTGRRGRPRRKGARLPALTTLAATATFTPATVTRYQKRVTVQVATLTCLWYSVFDTRAVQVVLVREAGRTHGFDFALVSTDTTASPAGIVERYAARWSIEVAIEDAKQTFGVGQARNRSANAVRRTVPFGLFCQTLTILWYAQAGHHPDDAAAHRARAPWYTTKAQPSVADMLAKLRRVVIAARFSLPCPDQPTPEEIHAIRLAWETTAA